MHENTPIKGVFYFVPRFYGELIVTFYSRYYAEENKWTIFGFGSSRR